MAVLLAGFLRSKYPCCLAYEATVVADADGYSIQMQRWLGFEVVPQTDGKQTPAIQSHLSRRFHRTKAREKSLRMD
jgi:hypothetical protein